MRPNATPAAFRVFAVFILVAACCLIAVPAFAHRARPTAPRARYQPLARIRPTQTAHWVHAADKHHARPEPSQRPERASRKLVRGRRQPLPVRVAHPRGRRRALPAPKPSTRTPSTQTPSELAVTPVTPPAAPVTLMASPVAAPVTVVSVIRQDAVHPQLEAVEQAATHTEILPDLYDERGRLHRLPALRGSHEILLRQNQMAGLDGLTRVADDDDLARMRLAKALVPIPTTPGLRVDERLDWNRRFCRPWVAQFLTTMAAAHFGEFHRPIQVNSAVRTVSFQVRLIRRNGNAAQADGDAASPHLTGQAVDLAKRGLSEAEIAWMRLYLSRLVEQGSIDVEEEFKQACFHISIYKRYAPIAPPQRIAATHRELTPSLAATLE